MVGDVHMNKSILENGLPSDRSMNLQLGIGVQGHRKQSADGLAQCEVGDEVANSLRAKRMAKF